MRHAVMLLISIPERGLIAMNIQIGLKKYMKYFSKIIISNSQSWFTKPEISYDIL